MSWSLRDSVTFSVAVRGAAYHSRLSRWVVVGEGSNRIATSDNDGLSWTPSPSGNTLFSTAAYGVAFGSVPGGNAILLAAGRGVATLAYSLDGLTWTSCTGMPFTEANGVAFNRNASNPLWFVGASSLRFLR